MAFQFEKLEVYQKALDWVEIVESLCEQLKGKVSFSLVDQFSRAALSIPLNIAEGNGRWHEKEKKQFCWIARGSVFECLPLIQIIYRKKLIGETEYKNCYSRLEIMAKMLTALIKSLDK